MDTANLRRRLDKAIENATGGVDRPASEAYAKGAAMALTIIAECLIQMLEIAEAADAATVAVDVLEH